MKFNKFTIGRISPIYGKIICESKYSTLRCQMFQVRFEFFHENCLGYSTHIHNISVQAHKSLSVIKTLTAAGCGKPKETLMATYKAVMRLALVYSYSIWSPHASSTAINTLQVMQYLELSQDTHKTQTYQICMTKYL